MRSTAFRGLMLHIDIVSYSLILLQFHQLPSSHLVPTLSTGPLLFCSRPAERVREHQPHHVGGKPAAGVGSLRLPADQADLRPAGEGVESLCCGVGRAQHPVGDVCKFPPEMRPGMSRNYSGQTYRNILITVGF